MAKCDRCLWSDQCRTDKNDCSSYSPVDELEELDKMIEEGLYEFRRVWPVYTRDFEE